ncbi:hypothetical protein [Bradyrhizobium japonicum]|uniref:hypothetical protein n=1 Tax=Bradyrhizobium japonicum TaxID=375 RepID=UPI000675FD47|nr:hypothetical protein [Bradyrhizobium japonicum]
MNTAKQVGDVVHLKVFATEDAAKDWLDENDLEGVAFEYDVIGPPARVGSSSAERKPPTEAALQARRQVVENLEKTVEGESGYSHESNNHRRPFAFGK